MLYIEDLYIEYNGAIMTDEQHKFSNSPIILKARSI